MGGFRGDEAQAAHQLRAGRDAEQEPVAGKALALTGRERSGDDHRAGMHRPAFERVVEILAVGGGPVDERRAERVEGALVADRRAAAAAIDARERRPDVLTLTGGHAEAADVEKETTDGFARGGRQR